MVSSLLTPCRISCLSSRLPSKHRRFAIISHRSLLLTKVSLYRVSIPAVQKYLREYTPFIIPECGEAYNHNNGTPHIEHVISRQINTIPTSQSQLRRLWGKLFYWAIMIINLKPAYNNPTITRYEAYLQTKPDLRAIRLLPIFSTL